MRRGKGLACAIMTPSSKGIQFNSNLLREEKKKASAVSSSHSDKQLVPLSVYKEGMEMYKGEVIEASRKGMACSCTTKGSNAFLLLVCF